MFKKSSDRKLCPQLNKPCIGPGCMWATKIRGTDPNTGHDVDEESCAIAWLPMLLIESNKAERETGAAVESFRNEMSRQQGSVLAAARIIATDSTPRPHRVSWNG